MREVLFRPRIGSIKDAYTGLTGDLVMLREASLPDVCIVCGTPANGGIFRAEFYPWRMPFWHVPFFYDIPYLIFGTRYLVHFPFFSICTDENFDIQVNWINRRVGYFRGVSKTFLKLLPRIPLELATELEGDWRQRVLRSLMT